MKKVLIAMFIASAGMGACVAPVQAHEGFRHYGYHGGYRNDWIAPVLIGGVIGYELSRPRPVYVEPAPVIVQQPPVVYTPQPIVQNAPMGYHWQEMIDPATGVRKIVAVPN
jgi:hypothetical protein